MARHYMYRRRERLRQTQRNPPAHAVMHGAASYVAELFGVTHRRVREALAAYDPNSKGLAAPHTELGVGSDTDSGDETSHHKSKLKLTAAQIARTRVHV